MNTSTRYLILLIPLLLLGVSERSTAQVSLSPTSLFISDNTGVNQVYVTNNGNTPQEVNIRIEFAYPTSDSTGYISMTTGDESMVQSYGLADNTRVFPRRLILQPGQTQTIRVQVLPMRDRPDGMYWSRVVVSSNTLTEDVDEELPEGAIGARLNYILEQSIPVFYRKGQNTTGVEVHDVHITRESDRLLLVPNLTRTGNSPYLGTMRAELYNEEDEMVRDTWSPAFFYFEEWRRLDLDVAGLPPGTYRLELQFETSRRDMSSTDIVQAPRQTHSMRVDLQ